MRHSCSSNSINVWIKQNDLLRIMFLTSDDWKQAKDSNISSRELSVEELYEAGVHLDAGGGICAGQPSCLHSDRQRVRRTNVCG